MTKKVDFVRRQGSPSQALHLSVVDGDSNERCTRDRVKYHVGRRSRPRVRWTTTRAAKKKVEFLHGVPPVRPCVSRARVQKTVRVGRRLLGSFGRTTFSARSPQDMSSSVKLNSRKIENGSRYCNNLDPAMHAELLTYQVALAA